METNAIRKGCAKCTYVLKIVSQSFEMSRGLLINHEIILKGKSQRSVSKVSFKHGLGEYELWAINLKTFFPLAKSCLSCRQMQKLVLFPFHQQNLLNCIWCPSVIPKSHMIYVILLALIPSNLDNLFFHVHLPIERKCFCYIEFDILILEILALTVHEQLGLLYDLISHVFRPVFSNLFPIGYPFLCTSLKPINCTPGF